MAVRLHYYPMIQISGRNGDRRRPAPVFAAAVAGLASLLLWNAAPAGAAIGDERLGAYLAARLAGNEDDLANAAKYYQLALATDPDNLDLLSTSAIMLLAAGQVDKAVALSEQLAAKQPDSAFANMLIAAGRAKKGDYAGATTFAQKIQPSGLNRLMEPLMESWALLGQMKIPEAQAALDKLKGNPSYEAFYNYHSALINAFAGKTDVATTAFQTLLRAGASSRGIEAYGNLMERTGKVDDATKLYRSYLDAQPEDGVISAALARALKGTKPEPLIPDAAAGMAEAFNSVAASLTQENSLNQGISYAQIALYLRDNFDSARMVLATAMERSEDWAAANASLSKIPLASPYSFEARLRQGVNLGRLNDVDGAAVILKKLGDERPASTEALTSLADIYRTHDRNADAVKTYDLAIARVKNPTAGDWVLFYTRGTSLERTGNWDRAEADFLQALKLQPDQVFVLNYLGYSWIERNKNIEQATAMIQNAVKQQPTAGFIIDSLGWGMFHLGKYDEAVTQLERAVALDPADATINDHLGDAYWKVGRKREAMFQWRHALDSHPDDALIPVLKKKMAQGLDG